MRRQGDHFSFSATEVGNFLACPHLSGLELRVAEGELERPGQNDIERRLLEKRGLEHEARVLEHYRALGRRVVDIKPSVGEAGFEVAFQRTLDAMREGVDVIYQGTLLTPGWVGRPDFLVRVETPSRTGGHLYEPVDAKLAREVKARAVLQLCAYADQLAEIQGDCPRYFHVASGGPELAPQALLTRDYHAYFRSVRRRMKDFVNGFRAAREPYPEPVDHCAVCRYWKRCEDRRRSDDHLSLVAGITRRQRDRLGLADVQRLEQLAVLEPTRRVSGIASESLERVRHQAALQLRGRREGRALYELLRGADARIGLGALPLPSAGDLFLDLEGDSFAGGDGLEYLFGVLGDGYEAIWAKNRAEEKLAFERVIDRLRLQRREFPDAHCYHFGHREADALKKLSCRHATREGEVDQLLREAVLVDLLPIVRHGLRASVESYTLKELEALHGFARRTPLRDAARAMQLFGWWLETGEEAAPRDELTRTVQSYNEDDCRSTARLREFLEQLRAELEGERGEPLPRPVRREAKATDEPNERQQQSAELARRLTEDPAHPRAPARALLAALLEFHWREAKSGWWEYHRARELPPPDRLEDRACIAELRYEGEVERVKQSAVHRYEFPEQEHALRLTPEPYDPDTQKAAGVIELGERHVLIKRGLRSAAPHPRALVSGKPIDPKPLPESLQALAHAVLVGAAGYEAAEALLYRTPPAAGAALVGPDEEPEQALARLAGSLSGRVLAVQGPPGTGKTYQAARLILRLLRQGKRVGVTANSHAVVKQVLQRVKAEATREGDAELTRIVHVNSDDDDSEDLRIDGNKERVRTDLEAGRVNLVGGTAWTWARDDFAGSVDALVIDEAGQMSLAHALSVARAGRGLVLFGDPAQLEQPQKGVHPPGAEVSALEHWLGGDALTIPPHLGVFLSHTRRLHPHLCDFVSAAFYEGRLKPTDGLGLSEQAVHLSPAITGSGVRFVRVEHRGNTSHAPEEVEVVLGLVTTALAPGATFRARSGDERPLTPSDVLVVAPYNAQVAALRRVLPSSVRVGTVDKFQGREAALVIYAMTSSSAEDAPRGLEFLYSRNRLNVAVSRAQALCVVVGSPELLRASCKTPAQMRLVNALCALLEHAERD